MAGTVIHLNGPSSVGKSSIAREIQKQARAPFHYVAMDMFLEMMPPGSFGSADGYTFVPETKDGRRSVRITSGPLMQRTLRGMLGAVAAMAQEGLNVVVDDVMFDAKWDEWKARLADVRYFRVGVFAPLDIIEARERARGDREIGLARAQHELVHRHASYDLEVDTGRATPAECAARIVSEFAL